MSVEITAPIWKKSSHKGSALLLLLYLGDCAHDDGTGIYPSVKSMAKKTRLEVRSCQYLLQFLVDSEELIDTGNLSEFKTKIYAIDVRKLGAREVNYKDFLTKRGMQQIAGAKSLHPATGCAGGDARGCIQSVIREPSYNNKENPVFAGMDSKAMIEETALSIFKLYPAKTPKAPAIRAIKKALKKNKAEFLREKTLQYAAVRGGDLEFVPHASTWFNQERFADEPETWKPKNTNGTNTNSKTNARSAKRSHAADSGTDKIAHLY